MRVVFIKIPDLFAVGQKQDIAKLIGAQDRHTVLCKGLKRLFVRMTVAIVLAAADNGKFRRNRFDKLEVAEP